MKLQRKDWFLLIIVLILLIPFFKYAVGISTRTGNSSSGDSGYPVYINEILASNSLYPDENGNFCDWIELHNSSSSPVDISRFGLTDSPLSIRYTFPNGTVISPGGYIVVFCSSGSHNGYAPFNISKSGGEEITLISESNVVVSTVKTVATTANHSMILDGSGKWVVSDFATPGFQNNETGRAEYIDSLDLAPADFRLTEVMASNTATIADCNNEFSDYIEITNLGENAVSLGGYYLSDSPDKPLKFRLPDVILQPQECALVFASGNELANAEIHAPFLLSSDGETIVLTSPIGETVDTLTYSAIDSDRAVALMPDGSLTVLSDVSPGYANTDDGRIQFLASRANPETLVINEVMTCNSSFLEQSDGEFYDWIELKNCSSVTVDLSDYYLTDNSDIKNKFKLPSVLLAPGGYYIVICSGNPDASNGNYIHAGFSLSAGEDSVFLYNSESELADYVHLIDLTFNGSYGRAESGENGFFYFSSPTPGSANGSGKRFVSHPPTASVASGIYDMDGKLRVEFFGSGDIRYTTDGSLPTAKSPLYSEPFELSETAVIRAACFSPDALNGDAATFSYFLSEGHTLPIVSLAVDPDDLWSDEKGIYVKGNHDNYNQRWEKYANVSLFEKDGSVSINCGLRLHGAGTRETSAKKSFKLCFRPKYGGELNYKVFDNSSITRFSSLLLRGGEDYTKTIFRDDLCQSLAEKGSNSLLTLDSKYCVLYINGEYFGVFSLREAYSEQYCADHLNVAPSGVTILEAPVYENSSSPFYDLLQYAKLHNMTNEDNYNYIKDRVDIDSLIDWYIMEAYCGNNDIPGNVRYVYSADDNKWRYCFFDLDWAFVAKGTCQWTLSSNRQHSQLFYALIQNPEFKDRFLSRMDELFDNALSDKQVLETIDYYAETLSPEIEREREKWGGTVRQWEKSVSEVRNYITANDRQQQVINSLQKYISLTDQEIEYYFGR